MSTTQQQAAFIRMYRKIHKYAGLFIALALLLLSLTGILLAWKKDSDWLQPPTQKVKTGANENWLSISDLSFTAQEALADHLNRSMLPEVDRLDVRPSKGIVKVLFEEGYWEVQLDGTNGKVLSIARRHSDWIEALHDGSLLSDSFKVLYSTSAGVLLLVLAVTGFWLWYGPKRLRKLKQKAKQ